MKLFVAAVEPPVMKSRRYTVFGVVYAAVLTFMAVTQLFSFETFTQLFVSFDLPGGYGGATLVSSLLIVAEVFALPYLLRMTVSPAFRWLSSLLSWLVAIAWLALSIWVSLYAPEVSTVGLLGTVISIPPGFGAIFTSSLLVVCAGGVSWAWRSNTVS